MGTDALIHVTRVENMNCGNRRAGDVLGTVGNRLAGHESPPDRQRHDTPSAAGLFR